MGKDHIISLETKEGHEYLIKLNIIEPSVIPPGIAVPVIDVTIELVNDVPVTNNAGTLFAIAASIKNYLNQNNAVLYCYCDSAPIQKRNPDLLNQAYRSQLFVKMFEKQNSDDFLNEKIIIEDPINGNHYIHLFAKNHNKPAIDLIAAELLRFNK